MGGSSKNTAGLFFLGLFICAGMAAGGYFVGQTMYNAKVALNTAQAKGLAERRVKSDRAHWDIGLSLSIGEKAGIPKLYKEVEAHQNKIIAILKEEGLDDTEIRRGIIDYNYNEYRDNYGKISDRRHTLSTKVTVETEKVDLITTVRAKINTLIAEGIPIQNREPRYLFTKLNDIKPDMLREATKNARIAANEFASNAGTKVGGIRSANQGSFFIRDAGEEYGDSRKIEKDVRVVTTITFYLNDN